MRAREGRKMSAISFSFARSGLANLLPATGGSPRCLRQLGSPPAIFLLPLRGYIAPRCAGQAKATPSRRGPLLRESLLWRKFRHSLLMRILNDSRLQIRDSRLRNLESRICNLESFKIRIKRLCRNFLHSSDSRSKGPRLEGVALACPAQRGAI